MSSRHFRLLTLGRLSLVHVAGETQTPVSVRPRHLFVLAVLAMAPRAVRRETLAAMFWGDEPEERARHSLSNALSALRGVLGRAGITAGRHEVALTADALLATDALEFVGACESHDGGRALALYRGPFLGDGLAAGAHSFEEWVDRERGRLERLFIAACDRHVPGMLRRQDWTACARVAEGWLRAAPRSAAAFVALLRAHAGPETAEALRTALAEYRRLRDWLWETYAIRTDPVVAAVAAELEERLTRHEARAGAPDTQGLCAPPVTVAGADALDPAPTSLTKDRDAPGRDARQPEARADTGSTPVSVTWWRGPRDMGRAAALTLSVCALAVAGLLAGAVAIRMRRANAARVASRPVIAVVAIDNVRRDSSLAWLEDGLPQLISEDLNRANIVDAVAPSRVRDVRRREGAMGAALAPGMALDVARRVDATWAVIGGLTSGNGLYVLDVEIREVGTARSIAAFTVRAGDPVQLGYLAAARVLEVDGARVGTGDALARFAGVVTTNPAAYQHFVRGVNLQGEGKYPDDAVELDAAIALDSGFVGALRARRDIARARDDEPLARRLDAVIDARRERMSEWDRLEDETERAFRDGARSRSEALGARAIERFPTDPRAYDLLATVLIAHGRWQAAESLYVRELALDSLAIAAGNGPCVPCDAFEGLVTARAMGGDLDGAVHAGRRWVTVQPASPRAWDALETALSFTGRDDDAVAAGRRAVSLSRDPKVLVAFGRTLLVARRYAAVDSLVRALRASDDPDLREGGTDLAATLERERGQYRRSAETLASPRDSGLLLVRADALARAGRLAAACRLLEAMGHPGPRVGADPINAVGARAYAWAHALEGDALARIGDSTKIRLLADSVAAVGAHSYYGRDWRLYHHLDGLVDAARGDWPAAERDFAAARWGVSGWTSSVLGEARAQLAQARPLDAVATLRDAYEGPLDAMGRYVPRSELDYWMARAWFAAGEPDSAARYVARVREAWSRADPDIRALLRPLADLEIARGDPAGQ